MRRGTTERVWLSYLLDTIAEQLIYEAADNQTKERLIYKMYTYYKTRISKHDELLCSRTTIRQKEAELASLLSGTINSAELERIEMSLFHKKHHIRYGYC